MLSALRYEFAAAIDAQLEIDLAGLPLDGPLSESLRYVVFPGGKRIRPVLAMTLCADFGLSPNSLVALFTPLEFVHLASLVHDDLPALDDDDYRRGRLTCHKKFSEATAILTADLMVAQAILLQSRSSFVIESKVALISELSSAFIKLCHGQQCDIDGATGQAVLRTHALKTGALFGAACAFGAIVSTQSEQVIDTARSLGVAIGIYFQAIDDYKDNPEPSSEQGRGPGSDQRNHRHTVITDFVETPDALLNQLRTQIDGCLKELMSACNGNFDFSGTKSIIAEIELPLSKAV
jgi:geranylgeranyl diphosphate synthase type II